MTNPTIQAPGLDSVTDDGNDIAPSTRKTLHQNILGKLRPLPFQYHWTVWYEKHSDSSNFEDRLYVLHEDVADIATFYRVYNNYPWDKVKLRDTVHIFRKGVKPVWEDPENLKGGCWTFRVPKAKSQAFFHEVAILCMANEFQAALEAGAYLYFSLHAIKPISSHWQHYFRKLTVSAKSMITCWGFLPRSVSTPTLSRFGTNTARMSNRSKPLKILLLNASHLNYGPPLRDRTFTSATMNMRASRRRWRLR